MTLCLSTNGIVKQSAPYPSRMVAAQIVGAFGTATFLHRNICFAKTAEPDASTHSNQDSLNARAPKFRSCKYAVTRSPQPYLLSYPSFTQRASAEPKAHASKIKSHAHSLPPV
jgi:hypothetical protein